MCTTHTLLSDTTQERWKFELPPRHTVVRGSSYTSRHSYTTQPAGRQALMRHQRGVTLVELLLAMLLSLIVSATAVVMLSNSLSANAQLMQYTMLSNELRKSMQMMSRDIRRAGYTAGAQWCLANLLCLPDASIALPEGLGFLDPLPLLEDIEVPAEISIGDDNDCFTFELDRDQDATIGSGDYGGYRLANLNGAGVLMTYIGSNQPACGDDLDSWEAITTTAIIDISEFNIDDDETFDEVVSVDLLGNTTTQRVRRIHLELTGRLATDSNVSESIETRVDVRNDVML